MEYLILNEESLPFANKQQAKTHFPTLVETGIKAFSLGFRAIRLSGQKIDKGWFEIPLLDSNYVVRNWLQEETDLEQYRRFKSFFEKTETPHIPEDEESLQDDFNWSEFYLNQYRDIKTPSLGASFLLGGLSLSFLSAYYWFPSSLLLYQETWDGGRLVSAKNCANFESWTRYEEELIKEKEDNLKKANTLWENRSIEFPNLIFCGRTEEQLQNFSFSNALFQQLLTSLRALNDYCNWKQADFSLSSIRDKTQFTMSDESDTVKNNPRLRRYRMFRTPSQEERVFVGYHIKNFSGSFRLYFLPSKDIQQIYIVYFGVHLPLR